jgi:hypothetical protein
MLGETHALLDQPRLGFVEPEGRLNVVASALTSGGTWAMLAPPKRCGGEPA